MLPILSAALRAVQGLVPGRSFVLSKAQRTRIVKAEVKRLALCRRGKNGLSTLYKADGSFELSTLVKSLDEGTLLAVAYAPERPDADGHLASAEAIAGMAHSFMRNGAKLDLEHDGKVLSPADAYVAECFTVQKSDERFHGWKTYDGADAGDLTGAWAVQLRIDNPKLREAYRRGEWDGVSLFGVGEGVPEQVITKSSPQEEPTMTPEQFKQLLDGLASLKTDLVKSVAELVKPVEPKKEEPAAEAAPTFSGDPLNPADLETFEKSLRAYEFRKAVASGKITPEKLVEMRKALSEPNVTDAEAGVETGDSPKVRELKLELFKAKKGSNAGVKAPAPGEKSQAELDVTEGLELAKAISGESKAPSFAWRVH